tara:strand:+ start:130 stop:870 length:741 start_codon:yes stop_codon:yes gene_type:complete
MKNFLLIFLLLPSLCFSLTFKKDGSIISSSGEIQRESIAVRYQTALEQFNNNNEITDWPTVKKTKNGKYVGKKGYFGEKILEEGAPLLSLENVAGVPKEQIFETIAIQNGFQSTTFLNISLIVNSNEEFRIENSIPNEQYLELKENFSKFLAIDPTTGIAPIALESEGLGNMIDDSEIELEGLELTDSLEVIAEKLDLDPSLVTSRAMAETLSSLSSDVSNEISSGPTSEPGYQAIDPNTGEAPKP